jgi:hypothetical protein
MVMQQSFMAFFLLLPALVDGFTPTLHGSERKLTICKISKEASSSQHVNIKESDWVQDAFALLEDLDDLLPPQRKTAATKADWFTNAMADFVPKKLETASSPSSKDVHEWFTVALKDANPKMAVTTNDWVPSHRHEWFSQAMDSFVPPETSAPTSPQQTQHADWFSEASMNYSPPKMRPLSHGPQKGSNEWFSQALEAK